MDQFPLLFHLPNAKLTLRRNTILPTGVNVKKMRSRNMRNSCAPPRPSQTHKVHHHIPSFSYGSRTLRRYSRTFSIKGQSSLDEQSKFYRICSPPRFSSPRRDTRLEIRLSFPHPHFSTFSSPAFSYPNNDRNNFRHAPSAMVPEMYRYCGMRARGVIMLSCISSDVE